MPTTRLGLRRPASGDGFTLSADLDAIVDALDSAAMYEQGAQASRPAATSKPYGYMYGGTGAGERVWVNVGTGGSRAYVPMARGDEFDTHVGSSTAHGNPLAGEIATPLQQGVISGGEATRLSSSVVRIAPGSGWVRALGGDYKWVTWVQTDITIPAASVNPRVDAISASQPTQHGDVVTLSRTAGSEAVGTTLSNTLPPSVGSQQLFAAVLSSTSGVAASGAIRDRRTWARGVQAAAVAPLGSNYTTSSGTAAAIDATGLALRVELSGLCPVRISLTGRVSVASTATSGQLTFRNSGSVIDTNQGLFVWQNTGIGEYRRFTSLIQAPTAGSLSGYAGRWR
jgi:hypothetical protein